MADELNDLLESLPQSAGIDLPVYRELQKLYLAIHRMRGAVVSIQSEAAPAPTSFSVVSNGMVVTVAGAPVISGA